MATTYVASTVQPSLFPTLALTTPGPQPPCPDPKSGPGPGSMDMTGPGAMALHTTRGMQPPPPVVMWVQLVAMTVEVVWMTLSRVLRWVSPCMGRRMRSRKQPDLQGEKASGDTLEDGNSVAPKSTAVLRRDTIGSIEKCLKCWLSKLLESTALPTASCSS